MDKHEKIGIFDSGIGGVTVLKEIIKQLPNEDYFYYSDSKNNPYGDKSDTEICQICDNIVKHLINNKCKIIVIACNTATAKAIDGLRKKYSDVNFIGIEPAYKMVHDFSFNEETLVMATKGTINSERFKLLVKKYNNNKTFLAPCVGLADCIENGDFEKIRENLKKNIGFYRGKVKNVVLGCTHYPIIKEEIRDILGDGIRFFYGAPNLAVHLRDVLEKSSLLNDYGHSDIIFEDSTGSSIKKKRFFELLKK